jgi:hypothetical protein
MGCVWQSEYAPVPRLSDTGVYVRHVARHRKPAWWRRAALPVLAAARARFVAQPRAAHTGGLAVAARER